MLLHSLGIILCGANLQGTENTHFSDLAERSSLSSTNKVKRLDLFQKPGAHSEELLRAVEIMASERHKDCLSPGQMVNDIGELTSLREEARYRDLDFIPVMLVVEVAISEVERMTSYAGLNAKRKPWRFAVQRA